MSVQSDSLAGRRVALQLQCALQRAQFAEQAEHLREGFAFADRGLEKVRDLHIAPLLMAAMSAAGLLSRASRLVRLVGRAWFIISTLRRLRRSPRKEASGRGVSRRGAPI